MFHVTTLQHLVRASIMLILVLGLSSQQSLPIRPFTPARASPPWQQPSAARYPLTIDPTFSQQAYFRASNSQRNDYFGLSVAVSGDTVVVGAAFESSNATGVNGNQSDNSAPSAGAAYVFVRSGTSWSQQAYLKASNTERSDGFGNPVAVAGDTVVVGANSEDSSATGVNGDQSDNRATDSGAAYVFVRSETSWHQQAYLKASNTGILDGFGNSVAVAGDTVVVGATGESSNAGAAYIFVTSPEIAVEQPAGTDLTDGVASVPFGNLHVGASTSRVVTIKNIGMADLTGLGITIDGSDAALFSVTAHPTAPVSGPDGSTSFTVRFAPTSTGAKTAALHIANNDTDENPFDITLTGTGSYSIYLSLVLK